MADTTNELVHDAIIRRQIYLQRFADGLSADVINLLDATEKDVRATLLDRLASLEGRDFSARTNNALEDLVQTIADIRQAAFDEGTGNIDEQMRKLAVDESNFLDSTIKDYAPVVLDTALPAIDYLERIIDVQPLQGRVLAEWAQRLAEADQQRISDAIKIGMAQGEATDDIVRRVIGTRALDGADGMLEVTRRDVQSIVQTATATVAGESRQAYYAENSDIIAEELYVAVLDSATTIECASLDGEKFPVGEGPEPPIHWNCRSQRVPLLDGEAIGDRPAVSATEDALSGLSDEERQAAVAEMVGTVPAKTTYSEFLARQTPAFQDEVLGATRGSLFRDGNMPLTKFVNSSGRTYTLDELRTMEPSAFSRAGL